MRNEMLVEPTGISEKIRAPDGIRTHDPPWSSRMLVLKALSLRQENGTERS